MSAHALGEGGLFREMIESAEALGIVGDLQAADALHQEGTHKRTKRTAPESKKTTDDESSEFTDEDIDFVLSESLGINLEYIDRCDAELQSAFEHVNTQKYEFTSPDKQGLQVGDLKLCTITIVFTTDARAVDTDSLYTNKDELLEDLCEAFNAKVEINKNRGNVAKGNPFPSCIHFKLSLPDNSPHVVDEEEAPRRRKRSKTPAPTQKLKKYSVKLFKTGTILMCGCRAIREAEQIASRLLEIVLDDVSISGYQVGMVNTTMRIPNKFLIKERIFRHGLRTLPSDEIIELSDDLVDTALKYYSPCGRTDNKGKRVAARLFQSGKLLITGVKKACELKTMYRKVFQLIDGCQDCVSTEEPEDDTPRQEKGKKTKFRALDYGDYVQFAKR